MTLYAQKLNGHRFAQINKAIGHGVMLPVLCVITYWLITQMLAQMFSVSLRGDLLGGM